MKNINPDQTRIERDILSFSKIVDQGENGYTRISFSTEHRKATNFLAELMKKEAGLSVRRDMAGNLIGRREGRSLGAPAIIVGSHLDTVREGGRFDGIAGVVAGLELARLLHEDQIVLEHPFEVVAFLAEEPSPFGISTIGSRAMAGKLKPEILNNLKDASGRTFAEALSFMSGDLENIAKARRFPDDLLAYIELHIEQGPFLEKQKIPIGIVTGIASITRGTIEIVGKNDHAGTTPMKARKDALSAAAEVIISLETACRNYPEIVGTVGQIDVFPNSLNVVPGMVKLGMELRGLDDKTISSVIELFEMELKRIRESRNISINHELWLSSPKVIFNPEFVNLATTVCEKFGIAYSMLSSGAGHDASHLADIANTAMIFIPSKDGRSHCPEEWTDFEDIACGTKVLGGLIEKLDKQRISKRN